MKVKPVGRAGNWSLFYNKYFKNCQHCGLTRVLKKFKNCPRCGLPIYQPPKNEK